MAILMGPFDHVTKVEYGGLFKDRRQNNFFYVSCLPSSPFLRPRHMCAGKRKPWIAGATNVYWAVSTLGEGGASDGA